MTQRLRFVLDTNILIPLQNSMLVLAPTLANFVRLAGVGGHQLLYHPRIKSRHRARHAGPKRVNMADLIAEFLHVVLKAVDAALGRPNT